MVESITRDHTLSLKRTGKEKVLDTGVFSGPYHHVSLCQLGNYTKDILVDLS